MSVIYTPRRPTLSLRLLLFPFVIAGLLVVLLLRLWYVQVVLAPEFADRAEVFNRINAPIPAPRGLIYDRNLKLIAGEQSQLVLMAEPRVVLKNTWVLDKVAALLKDSGAKSSDSARLLKKTKDAAYKPDIPSPVYAGLPIEVAAKIAEMPSEFPGLGIEAHPIRYYADSKSFSQLLGYVWIPSENDVARAQREGRKLAPLVGKGGIEWQYEQALAGAEGYESTAIDKRRRAVRVAETNPPTPGKQLVLSLDSDLQSAAIQALGSNRGAVVALDPESGEILCMVSTPSYDLSLFRNGISQEDFDRLANSPDHPFINRAVASAFSPGSTFKIVTTVAAMRAGVFDPRHVVDCRGGYSLGRQYFKCLGHHGDIRFREALEHSCNTYFSDLSMMVGKDVLRQTALDMGFFGKTGIDLPYERTGLIPTDAWLRRAKRPWVPGYTVLTGIGQGDVLTTPLQMANLAAIVASGGTTFKPHLLHGKRQAEGSPIEVAKPEVLHHIDLPDKDWDLIREAMIGVIDEGTAAGSQIDGIQWAGKTGSAEVRGQQKTNSWFIGYAPANHPRIAICAMVEAVGHGSDFAAPIARQVVERFLGVPKKS